MLLIVTFLFSYFKQSRQFGHFIIVQPLHSSDYSKAHIPLETAFALATQHKQHEMYMPNARILLLEPNATYIPLTRVGGWRLVTQLSRILDTNMLV